VFHNQVQLMSSAAGVVAVPRLWAECHGDVAERQAERRRHLPDLLPDLWRLVDDFDVALEELFACAVPARVRGDVPKHRGVVARRTFARLGNRDGMNAGSYRGDHGVGINAFRGLALWTVERKSLPNLLGEHRAACARMVGRKG
jgi:hypothetical protein